MFLTDTPLGWMVILWGVVAAIVFAFAKLEQHNGRKHGFDTYPGETLEEFHARRATLGITDPPE